MGTLHFRNARVYLAATSAAAAVQIAEARSFELVVDGPALSESSGFDDDWVTYDGTSMSWSASFEANFDTAQTTVFDAATQKDGAVRWYGYPNASSSSRFYSGLVWVKFSVAGGIGAPGRVRVDLTGDGAITAS